MNLTRTVTHAPARTYYADDMVHLVTCACDGHQRSWDVRPAGHVGDLCGVKSWSVYPDSLRAWAHLRSARTA